jgi:membrane protease YdiL (CAAX protease family)
MADPGMIVPPEIPGAAQVPAPAAPRYTMFRGPNGIRAGWRVLLFLCFAFLVGLLLASPLVVMRVMHKGGVPARQPENFGLTPGNVSIMEGAFFLCFSIAALIMAKIEHRKFGKYGLPLRSAFGKDFWIGGIAGFLAIGGCLLGIFALHGFRLEGIATHGAVLLRAIAAWSLSFVLVGLAEEFTFRGYLQYTLTTGIGFWPSAILLSVLFGFAHSRNPGESTAGLLSVVMFGLLFCLFLRRRGNLWWAVGFHAGWDWGQTFFYGVPDSGIPAYHSLFHCSFNGPAWLTGGTVGPEASVFTPIVLAIVTIAFANAYPEIKYRVNGGPQTAEPAPQPSV